jgi:alpha-galactosidase
MPPAPSGAYEAVWCSWGYHRDVTQEQILGMMPLLKDMGIKWVVLDDGWFDVMGDWNTREKTYRGGEKEIKNLVTALHKNGFKVKLWTLPGVADGNIDIEKWEKEHPAMRTEIIKHPIHRLAKVAKEHPHWFVREKGGQYAISKRANYYFCPSLPEVQEHFRKLTVKFIRDWDFDGFKQDAVYICPPCYDKSHNHPYPEKAAEDYARILEIIFKTTTEIKPEAVVETCPCGVTPTFTWFFWQNQTVTADPVGSWQCRTRHKALKALAGPVSAVLSDHIEITDGRDDFATQIGIGGVVATRFTPTGEDIPSRVEAGEDVSKRFLPLNEEKRAKWKKWLGIYHQKMLAKGEYLNLYDVVYDVPETHCIRKDDKIYYAFYHTGPAKTEPQYEITSADENSARLRRDPAAFAGEIELRGLDDKTYRLYDYVNDVDYGEVKGPGAKIKVEFSRFLLLEATPQDAL